MSAWGKNTSAIGLATSPMLNPSDSAYRWTDEGIVAQTRATDDHNAIGTSVCADVRTGDLWMTYGSFWSGLKAVRLDPKTGGRYRSDAAMEARAKPNPPIALAWSETIEAPCLHQRGKWWRLFVNWGWRCRGVNSTYEIRIGRSDRPSVPFRDRDGKDLLQGGGSPFLSGDKKGEGAFIGPGHAGIVTVGKNDFLSCHFYDGDRNGAPTLGILPLRWSADGRPVTERKKVEGGP